MNIEETYKDKQAIESSELEQLLMEKGLSEDEMQSAMSRLTVELVYSGKPVHIECANGEILTLNFTKPKEDIN